jgi:hypothetical protein
MALRAQIFVAVFLAVLVAATTTASADVRSFRPARAGAKALTFKLRGLHPAEVRRATLRAPGARRRVRLSTIRRAARRGVLRVRWSRLGSHAAHARVARAGATSLTVTTCSSSSSSYADAVRGTAGLVSHWRVGESSGTVACDEVQRNAGTYASGIVLGQTGAIADGNRAAGFSGGTRMSVASSASLAPGAGLSVETWIKPTSTASQTLVRKDGQYLLRISSGNVVARVWLASGSYVELASPAVVQTSAFQHVALTYDRSTLRIYRNGMQVASRSAAGTPAGSSRAVLVGSSDGYDGFSGTIDEVAVYNQALSASQLAAHVSAATATAPAPSPTPEPTPAPTPAPTPDAGTTCSASLTSFGPGSWPDGCWRPYLSTSFFNKPVTDIPKVHPNSAAMVTKLLSTGSGPANLTAGEPAIDDYKHPTVYARSGDPEYVVHCTKWACDDLEGKRVRIPVGARPAGGGDGHLGVVDRETGYEYDFWQAEVPSGTGGTLNVSLGGVSQVAGPLATGASLDLDGDGRLGEATAARFGLMGGIIRAEELAAGRINHAVFITIPCGATSPTHVLPATKGGTYCSDTTDRIPMGARLQLAMTAAEIDALAVPAWKKTILHAMRTYGMYFGDTGGPSSFGVMLESGATYTAFGAPDRMVEFAKQNGWSAYNGYYVARLRDGVPWNRLRVLDWSDPANR